MNNEQVTLPLTMPYEMFYDFSHAFNTKLCYSTTSHTLR